MTDRSTKILFAAIAIGLWANIGMTVFRPVTAMAQSTNEFLANIDGNLSRMAEHLERIGLGTCINKKIYD